MVKIRLRRVGAKNKPMYRIVVADSRSPRDGAFIEVIGHYNPLTDPETVDVDKEKAIKWLGYGAKPTDTVARLLAKLEVPMPLELKSVRKPKAAKSKSKKSTTKTETPTAKTETPTAKTETPTAKET
jgi:small subunit ribosomal protein S16